MKVIRNNLNKASWYHSSLLLVTSVVLVVCGEAEDLQTEPQRERERQRERESNKNKRHVSLSQPWKSRFKCFEMLRMPTSKQLLDFCRGTHNPSTNSYNKKLLNPEDGSSKLLRQFGNCLLVPEDLDPIIKLYIFNTVYFLTFCISTNKIY